LFRLQENQGPSKLLETAGSLFSGTLEHEVQPRILSRVYA
jgi:hypothetical protein